MPKEIPREIPPELYEVHEHPTRAMRFLPRSRLDVCRSRVEEVMEPVAVPRKSQPTSLGYDL